MNTITFRVIVSITICIIAFPNAAFAYGSGGSSKKACDKPRFTKMTPPAKSVVAPGSEFSFEASSKTNPKTLNASIKGQNLDLKINELSSGRLQVTGFLPELVAEGFVRIKISAKSSAKCTKQDGWLLMIESK